MKLIWVLAAFCGVSFAATKPYSLSDDVQDFLNLIDIDKIESICVDNLKDNGDLIEAVAYQKGEAWAGVIAFIADHPGWIKLKDWLVEKDIPVDDVVTIVQDYVENVEVGTPSGDRNRNLASYLTELVDAVLVNDIVDLADKKLITNPDFRELLDRVRSEDTHKLVDDVLTRLTEMGLGVDEGLAGLYEALEWGEPPTKYRKLSPRSLEDDLKDFVNLLPLDITAILNYHLATDGAFVAVVDYLQRHEWADLVDTVSVKPAVKDFVQYLNDAGIPVYDRLTALHDWITYAVLGTDPDNNGSLRPLLDEVEAIIPVTDLVAMLNGKLQNSPDFQALYMEISSEDACALVEEVIAIDEVQRLRQRLTDLGVKVDDVLAILYEFLGWGKPPAPSATIQKISPSGWADYLHDFGKLSSLDVIKSIFEAHLASDIVDYFQGDDGADLVATVLDKLGINAFVQYLNDAGFRVDDILANLPDVIARAVRGI